MIVVASTQKYTVAWLYSQRHIGTFRQYTAVHVGSRWKI